MHKLLSSGLLFFSVCLLVGLLPAGAHSSVSSAYSLDMAAGYSNNVDRQQTAKGSAMLMTAFNGLWSFELEGLLPFELEGALNDVRYTAGNSSQQLDLGSGLWLWRTAAAELTIHGRWQHYQNGRLPADDFHGPSVTLQALTNLPPFLFYLAQDLHWHYFKQSVEHEGIGGDNRQHRVQEQNDQQMQFPQTSKRHERNKRSRLGVELQVTQDITISSDISYADNRASIVRERWIARGAGLGLQWWPKQLWQGQVWWQHQRTDYHQTANNRNDRTDTLSLRVDYRPGVWQYYTRWQWQRNESSQYVEDYREQEITCGVMYHF